MSQIVVTNLHSIILLKLKIISVFVALVLLPLNPIYSQTQTVSTSLSITRFDFFHAFEYEFQPSKFAFSAGLGYGINRTIFQKRFYPRMTLGSTYYWLNKERFQIGPHINYAFSFIRLTPASKLNEWNELNAGLQWSYGNKWKIGQTIVLGYVSESHYSTIENKRVHARTLNYFISLALKYEI